MIFFGRGDFDLCKQKLNLSGWGQVEGIKVRNSVDFSSEPQVFCSNTF
jgi:hypothetical protein